MYGTLWYHNDFYRYNFIDILNISLHPEQVFKKNRKS